LFAHPTLSLVLVKEFNKLFWGDNLQVLSHLLKEYRGKVDLIYIDPPFDSKADYVKKVKIRGEQVEGQKLGLLEEKQYSDIWEKDEYLQFMYERLLLMKELLSDRVRERIKTIRLKKKLSQGDIAKVLGVHAAYISQIERGERNPTLANIEKIAGALGVTIGELIK